MKYVQFALVASALMAAFTLAPEVSGRPQARVLKTYKRGPICDLRNEFWDTNKFNEEKAPCRQFMWQSLKNRSKAMLSILVYTREGDQSRCRFFVEPNSKGEWVVVQECSGGPCPYISKARCRKFAKQVFSMTSVKLQRIELGYDPYKKTPPIVLQDSEIRDPSKFAILFIDSAGQASGPF